MFLAQDFIKNNSEGIKKEVTDIMEKISESLSETGFIRSATWGITHVPNGLTEYVAKIVEKELKQFGWVCTFFMDDRRSQITFTIYPNTDGFR